MVGKIAFLFPGQGSQCIGMGKLAIEKSPASRQLFEKADHILGFSLSNIMLNGPDDQLRDTAITQPALFVSSAAALELLKEKGIQGAYAAGHSLGEYSALYSSGVFTFEMGVRLVRERGLAMNEGGKANPGTMAAIIGLDSGKIEEVCREAAGDDLICSPANYNSDSQVVISGSLLAVKKAMELATLAGAAKVVQLNVSGAFHSALMGSAAHKMKSVLQQTTFVDSGIPVITNVDAQPTQSASEFKEKLFKQIDHPVRWNESMKKLLELGAESFIEVGSGRVLSTLIKKLDRKKQVYCTDEFETIERSFTCV
ncbi:MAG: Malonyl CoA-acyl carrier protein transacylase [Elusimicrobia bacterium]|nr:Malonyl CoA-acyl carrier protein transacylase [Elusimicrobiota bacterium]